MFVIAQLVCDESAHRVLDCRPCMPNCFDSLKFVPEACHNNAAANVCEDMCICANGYLQSKNNLCIESQSDECVIEAIEGVQGNIPPGQPPTIPPPTAPTPTTPTPTQSTSTETTTTVLLTTESSSSQTSGSTGSTVILTPGQSSPSSSSQTAPTTTTVLLTPSG